jgi:aminotransferase in exopolysaccharide biosynthesis|tara:strand:- start:58 stop:1203 length:1146 start_codon:yes stop_codon:yes gene_type:complete
MSNYQNILEFIKNKYPDKDLVNLHEPKFFGNEKDYVLEAIDSTYVSSSGKFVDNFEIMLSEYTNTKKAVALVNGTSALQIALKIIGVSKGDEVITQALTFIATANAISYNNASPIFLDVDLETMGLSPQAVENFLDQYGELRDDGCYNKKTNKKISACLPMHTFGFPVDLDELIKICNKWRIPIVEDAAEALGSKYKNKHVGGFGSSGVFSFNGNKIITSGGGGAIVFNNKNLANKAKHLVTTAKVKHPYEYIHDEIGFNYRMPNINAALACAQLEQINLFLKSKRKLASEYKTFFNSLGIKFKTEQEGTQANFWLMCIELENKKERNQFLKESNNKGVFTRPIWQLLSKSQPYSHFYNDSMKNSIFLEERIVNIPSSFIK